MGVGTLLSNATSPSSLIPTLLIDYYRYIIKRFEIYSTIVNIN